MKINERKSSSERADELFEQNRKEIYLNTDQLFVKLMVGQWLVGITAAILIAPRTWAGQMSHIHIDVWGAIFIGGVISAFPIWMIWAWPGAAVTRHTVAVAQMLMSALLIDLTGGRIETHFHVFCSLVILSFYRDWRVLISAAIVVGLDHFVRGVYWPYSVYGVLTASPWRSVEHAGWVLFEDIFLIISCLRSVCEMRSIANRTAALEADIIERKQTEDALRKAEEKYRAMFENAVEGIFQTTPEGGYISANPALARMYGYQSPEELMTSTSDIGGNIYVIPERRNEFKRLIEAQGSVELFEYEVYRKDRSKIWLCENARAARGANGEVLYYEGSVEDITHRKRVEEVERANNAKSEFLSRVSHELRTPLNAILGFGQLLERQNPTDTQRTRISHILRAGKHLLDLINEVLDISRIESGKMQLSLEPVCVSDAFTEALDLMRPLAAERRIQLAVGEPFDNSVFAMADRQRFKQVLLNLLTNAVKYTPVSGGVTVSYHANGTENVRVVVADTGPGIPNEKLERIFTPFERLGAEQSNVEGTGLGLAVSQRLMQAMHGSIGLESTVGKGSTFWIELPRTKSPLENPSLQKKNGDASRPRPNFPNRKVLYIEDNLSNLTLIEQMLEERPEIELLTAMQGKVGLDLASQHSPDLILLDVHLPDIDGRKVISELKSSDTTRNIPVVVISADATMRQIDRLMTAGADTYLTKPLDVANFFQVLDKTTAPKMEKNSTTARAF